MRNDRFLIVGVLLAGTALAGGSNTVHTTLPSIRVVTPESSKIIGVENVEFNGEFESKLNIELSAANLEKLKHAIDNSSEVTLIYPDADIEELIYSNDIVDAKAIEGYTSDGTLYLVTAN